MEEIKEKLIEYIKKNGFPVGFMRGEADGGYGMYVESEKKVIPLEYALEFCEKELPLKLIDLSVVDLAYLAEQGIRENIDYLKESADVVEIEDENKKLEKYKSEK